MAKNKCPECPKCLPGWLVQFGDLMSLLLTFFILLLSMAVMDKTRVEEYFEIMKKAMGFLDSTTAIETQSQADATQHNTSLDEEDGKKKSLETALEEITEIMEEINDSNSDNNQDMSIEKSKNEFILDIPSTILFNVNEYKIESKAIKKFITKISRIIRTIPQTLNIEVSGHTQNNDYKSNSLPRNNWDLSALRAISVVQELIKNKIDPSLLKVSAFSSFHPKSEIDIENRRVEIRFFAQDSQEDILKEENFFDRLE